MSDVAKAGPGSDVLPLLGEVFPAKGATNGRVSLTVAEHEQLRKLANMGAAAAARSRRESSLNKAVRDGRIARTSVPEWRAKYNADPTGTMRQINALAAGTVRASAPGQSSAQSSAQPAEDDGNTGWFDRQPGLFSGSDEHAQYMARHNPGAVRRIIARATGRNVETQHRRG